MVSVVIDLTEKIDSFIKYGITFRQAALGFYLNFIPYIDSLLSPLFVFISVIFFTSKMASNSEIIAMLGGGISVYRILVPYFISTAIIAGMLLYANHFLVPESNRLMHAFEYTHMTNKNFMRIKRTMQMQIKPGVIVYVENYTHLDSVGYRFSYEVIKDGHLLFKLKSDRISWLTEQQKWRLNNYQMRVFDRNREYVYHGQVLDTSLGFKPQDFDVRLSISEEMKTPQLKEYINTLKMRGSEDLPYYLIEYYRRTSDAIMTFVMMLIGYSIASRKARGGIGLHIVAGFALSSIYILLGQFTKTFSTNDNLPAFWGVWIPNILFGMLAIWLLRKAQQ
jgi:lipopolysaccharide export system permease protein